VALFERIKRNRRYSLAGENMPWEIRFKVLKAKSKSRINFSLSLSSDQDLALNYFSNIMPPMPTIMLPAMMILDLTSEL